ncbi:MAG: hypothetical protein SNH79_01980 [Rikenellaceae bacterium]
MIFIFPTIKEAEKFHKNCPTAEVIICGVGMAETAAAMVKIARTATREELDTVILAGIAGAYDCNEFPLGTVVEVSAEQIEELPRKYRKQYDMVPRYSLPTATSNCVSKPSFEGAKSQIENMEGASAAAICQALGIQFTEIRAISNRVGDEFEKWSIEPAIDALTDTLTTIYNKYNR